MPGKKNVTSTGDDQGGGKETPHEAPNDFTNQPPPAYTGSTFADSDDTTLIQMSTQVFPGLFGISFLARRLGNHEATTATHNLER